MLVYFKESRRLKKLSGMMTSMKTVIQKLRSIRKGTSAALPSKPSTTPGIRSPMMIIYDTPTPKHLIAIAASNMTAAFGYVIWERAKKEDDPRSRYRAHRDWRYKPKADVNPDQSMTMIPSRIPKCDIAEGIANVPAPITAKQSALTSQGRHCWHSECIQHTSVEEIDDAADHSGLASSNLLLSAACPFVPMHSCHS